MSTTPSPSLVRRGVSPQPLLGKGVSPQPLLGKGVSPQPLLGKEGHIPCEAGGAYSPPYQGGVGGG